jgi:hypothetical protein
LSCWCARWGSNLARWRRSRQGATGVATGRATGRASEDGWGGIPHAHQNDKTRLPRAGFCRAGAPGGDRTHDPGIKNRRFYTVNTVLFALYGDLAGTDLDMNGVVRTMSYGSRFRQFPLDAPLFPGPQVRVGLTASHQRSPLILQRAPVSQSGPALPATGLTTLIASSAVPASHARATSRRTAHDRRHAVVDRTMERGVWPIKSSP